MSSSPKYSRARLREQIARRLREEHRRKVEAAIAMRRAKEDQKRRERLESSKNFALCETSEIEKEMENFSHLETFKFVDNNKWNNLSEQLKQLKKIILQAQSDSEVYQCKKSFYEIRNTLKGIKVEAEASQFATRLANESAIVEKLKLKVSSIDTNLSQKFDPQERQEILQLQKNIEILLYHKELDKIKAAGLDLQKRIELHQTNIQQKFVTWAEKKEQAESIFTSAEDKLVAISTDKVVMKWASQEINKFQLRLQEIATQIKSEKFEQSQKHIISLLQELDQIIAQANEMQLKEDYRQYVVNGIIKTMSQMGFIVQSGYPALEYPEMPNSATIIQAKRLGGGYLGVSIPQEGEIWYDINGFPMQVESNSKGQTIKTCDHAEQEIQKIHTALEDTFGIEMGELLWEGKDPTRIKKTADRLPDYDHIKEKKS